MKRDISHSLRIPLALQALISVVILSACASNRLIVESNPDGADVYTYGTNNSKNKAGKTPLELTNTNTPALFRETLQVTVQKEGYKSESFLVPPASTTASGRILAHLPQIEGSTTTNEVSEGVALILRLIYKKSYVEAERSLATFTVKFANVSIFWDLLGNVRYLQKNLDQALEAYQTSLLLNPKNSETEKMIAKIKSIRGKVD
jgi:hypothetical protein